MKTYLPHGGGLKKKLFCISDAIIVKVTPEAVCKIYRNSFQQNVRLLVKIQEGNTLLTILRRQKIIIVSYKI